MTTLADLDRYVTGNDHTGRVTLRLPNRIRVSIIPDARRLLQWELLAEHADRVPATHPRLDPTGLAAGLSTAEAETLIAELADLPKEN